MPTPSTDWRERPSDDEAARHAADAARLVAIQRAVSGRQGNGRALHRKQLIALHATLRVHDGLPGHARHGLFAAPGPHMAWVRLSNGGTHVRPDRAPDIRGFALRVFGVRGPGALGGTTTHQDFLLINKTAFAFPDSRPFVGLVEAATAGGGAILMWALRSFGPLRMFGALKRLAATQSQPFAGFAAEPFNTCAPLRCGPYAVRARLLPPPGQAAAAAGCDWGDDLVDRLAAGPLIWRLQLQFFVDEARTPIEDASVDWPDSVAPWLTVADLVVEPQDLQDPSALAFVQQVETSTFDPWQALEEHRPLGEVMRARKVAYFESQKLRGAVKG